MNTFFSDDERNELREAARYMSRGFLGGFAAYIGDAMLHADDHNLNRLRLAFPELVQRAWDQIAIADAIIILQGETIMDQFIVWGKAAEFIVNAETPIRAIQAVMLVNGGFAFDYNVAPLSIYSDKAQAKIRANARSI